MLPHQLDTNLNALAAAAGLASLDDDAAMQQATRRMVGDREEVKADLLRPRGLLEQVIRVVKLAHQAVAVSSHVAPFTRRQGGGRSVAIAARRWLQDR